MTSIFISYSHANQSIVNQVITYLKQHNIQVWVDYNNLTPRTSDWEKAIRAAIQEAEVVVYMASVEARESAYVGDELNIATSLGRSIITLFIDGKDWINAVPLGRGKMQYIEARGPALPHAMAQLLGELTGQPAPVTLPPPPPPYTEISIPATLHRLGFVGQCVNGTEVIVPPVVAVPAGAFPMGSDKSRDPQADDDELPQYMVPVAAFSIAKYPLTVAEYAQFVAATKRTVPPDITFRKTDEVAKAWQGKTATWDMQGTQRFDHPVVNITWLDAIAYADWLAKVIGQRWRLPTEAEWEKAARGPDGRIYPWGDTWDASKANTRESGPKMTTPVGSYPQGASPYGAMNMIGNVWEWTSTSYLPYPYNTDNYHENRNDNNKVLRGGSWVSGSRYARVAYRDYLGIAYLNYLGVGVRVALSPPAG